MGVLVLAKVTAKIPGLWQLVPWVGAFHLQGRHSARPREALHKCGCFIEMDFAQQAALSASRGRAVVG